MDWKVEFDPRALTELQKLDRTPQKRILKFLLERIQGINNPRQAGKALTGGKVALWRYRVGDYRIISHLDDANHTVLILRIAHCKEAYR